MLANEGNELNNEVDLSVLNPAQLKALKEINGAIMVLAGAGSGKTRLVTYRIAHLVKDLHVDPENILAITFTNKAANEMKSRLVSLLGIEAEDIWISTFHSMCVKILRKHISSLRSSKDLSNNINFDSNFSIYTDTEKDKAIKTVLENLKINKEGFAQKVSHHISKAKNKNLSPWEYKKLNMEMVDIDDVVKCYSAYQSYLASNNALDFDDLLTKTYELFNEFPDILNRYQARFKYIHIDEFQDTNHIQYRIAHALALGHGNLFVVGDEDQCIYSWRGANIQNIRDFRNDFPEHKILKLEQNYRSTKQILTIANNVIKNNQVRNEKELWTENNIGDKPVVYSGSDEFNEAEFVAGEIKRLVDSGEAKYNEIAVLTRLNALSAPFEEKFLNYNIPYKIYGGNKFFERLEIKNLISYLKLLTNPYDSTSFARIINFPKRGIGEATINSILSQASFHNTTPYNLILNSEEFMLSSSLEKKIAPFKDIVVKLHENYSKLEPFEFIKFLVKTIDFKSIYNKDNDEDTSRLLNIDNFVVMAQNFYENNPKSKLSEFLQSITLISDIDEYDEEDNNVTIATVHAVKGLEFKVVFVAGLEERMFPIVRSYSSSKDLEEERRLMFVAITRAKTRLYLTYARSRFLYGKRDYATPSRFLGECGLEMPSSKFSKPAFSSFGEGNFGGSYAGNYGGEYGKGHYSSSFGGGYSSFGGGSYSSNTGTTYNSFSTTTKFTTKQKSAFSGKSFSVSSDNATSKNNDLEKKYSIGTKVSHPKFGIGEITSNQGIAITKCVSINFKDFGIKTLSTEYAPLTIIKGE